MSSRSGTGVALAKMMREQQLLKLLEQITPQLFTDGQLLDKTQIDEWKMAVIDNPAVLMSLIYFEYRGKEDHLKAADIFVNRFLRGSAALGGLARKQGESISVSLGGGKGKVMQRKGWLQRNITQRGQPEFEEQETE